MKANVRDTEDLKTNCMFCKYFESYKNYYEDELEPYDFGFCHNGKNSEADESFGIGVTCDLFNLTPY